MPDGTSLPPVSLPPVSLRLSASTLTRVVAVASPAILVGFGLYGVAGSWRGPGPILLALGWKLALAPAIVALAGMALGVTGMVYTIAVLQAAMAPMISATILATQNDLEPELANTILGAGILVSFVTVPLVNHWLRL